MMIAPRRGAVSPGATLVAWLLCLLPAALLSVSCDKVALTAPNESTISLFASSTVVPLNGSVDITATVVEAAGTPVHNGTVVTFTTTVGRIEPNEARTQNGKATVRLIAGNTSGTASVSAFSGGATVETPLEILVGGAAAARVTLGVTPGSVPATGGTVNVTAVVTDESGNGVAGVPVTFTSSAGSLSSPSAITDENGVARTQLTTNRETTVRAFAGAQTAEQTITVNPIAAIGLTATPGNAATGQPVTFSITVSGTQNNAPLQNVQIDFGDGNRVSLGSVSGQASAVHVYTSPGTYTVTVTGRDSFGETTSGSTVVVVTGAGALQVTLSAGNSSPTVNTTVDFTATVTTTSPDQAIERFEWDFGDGQSRATNGNTTTHVYNSLGVKVVSVRVVAANGQSGRATIELTVVPAAP